MSKLFYISDNKCVNINNNRINNTKTLKVNILKYNFVLTFTIKRNMVFAWNFYFLNRNTTGKLN